MQCRRSGAFRSQRYRLQDGRLIANSANTANSESTANTLVEKQYILVVLHLLMESFGYWWRKNSGGEKCVWTKGFHTLRKPLNVPSAIFTATRALHSVPSRPNVTKLHQK
ncbi:hypothetical protein EYF80_003578 [Liparis tanakae]|uniref:Uncharacterized protein n=1 Tax=Liparis tanakae TaxID=230148 RepID=A0A4Z2J8C7_9TELE|nr:hypothetical protein EYF80_003578 [Liparis tanakae]